MIHLAHDCSEGGLFVTLLESAMAGGTGFSVFSEEGIRKDAWLFGEAQSRVVVSADAHFHGIIEAELQGVPFTKLGTVNRTGEICVDEESWGFLGDWQKAYDGAIGGGM